MSSLRPARPSDQPSVLFGLPIAATTLDDVVAQCETAIRHGRELSIGVVNAAKIVHLRSDDRLRDSVLSCDVIVADGQSVVAASRVLGQTLPERVAGIDLFYRLLELADRERFSVFLLGATPAVLDMVVAEVSRRWPGVRIAGYRDGYFRDEQADEVAEQIRESGADMLFIGMSSPRKENFIAAHAQHLKVRVLHGVGGSFDVLAGVTKRAPQQVQKLGLEWAYRVAQEPRRLWRRYATTNTAFVVLTLRERRRPTPAYPRQPRKSSV